MYILIYLIILRVSFFVAFSPCFYKAVQVFIDTKQSVILQKTYSTKPTSSFHFCLLGIWIKATFLSLSTFKIKKKVEIYYCCIPRTLFTKATLLFEKVISVKQIKTKKCFYFFKGFVKMDLEKMFACFSFAFYFC